MASNAVRKLKKLKTLTKASTNFRDVFNGEKGSD